MRYQIFEAFIDRNLRSNFIKSDFKRNQQTFERGELNKE